MDSNLTAQPSSSGTDFSPTRSFLKTSDNDKIYIKTYVDANLNLSPNRIVQESCKQKIGGLNGDLCEHRTNPSHHDHRNSTLCHDGVEDSFGGKL